MFGHDRKAVAAATAILTGLYLGIAMAAPSRAQTLPEALAAAYTANPTLLAARAGVRATDEEVPQALSGWRPTVTVNGRVNYAFTDSISSFNFSAGEQRVTTRSVELEVSQPLYRGGRTIADTNRAEAQVMAGRADLMVIEQDVLLTVVRSYMDVVRDQSVVALNINNEEVLARQLEAARDRFEVGEVTRTDVSQAEARLSDAQASRVEAQGDLEVSRANFFAATGLRAEELDFPPDEVRPILPESESDALALALRRNPRILRAGFNERVALFEISAAGGRLLPELSLDMTVGRALDPTSFTEEQDNFAVGVNARIPLYQSGEEYARVRQARQIAAQRRRELDEVRRDVTEANSRWWEELVAVRSRIEAFESSVVANQIALDGVQQEAAVGARTVLDVLDAEQELFNAKVNLVRTLREEAVIEYEVVRVIGSLNARDLRLPVQVYDPTQHYNDVRDKWFGFGSDYQGGDFMDVDTDGMFDFLDPDEPAE